MAKINERKTRKIYEPIDTSDLHSNPAKKDRRSRMNVPFMLKRSSLDAKFFEEAAKAGLAYLKGHRSVSGMRASIQNAIAEAAIDALTGFMAVPEKANGRFADKTRDANMPTLHRKADIKSR